MGSETKFTPGPLHVWHQPEDCRIDYEWSIMSDLGEPRQRVVALIDLVNGSKADLQLWAAAPDLYAALKSALGWIAHWERDVDSNCVPTSNSMDLAAEEIRTALAKASPTQSDKDLKEPPCPGS